MAGIPLQIATGLTARLALDDALVRVADGGHSQHVLIVQPGGRREFVERRHLVLPPNSQRAAEDAKAFAAADELARARASSNARVIADEAERQACARAAAGATSTASLASGSGLTGASGASASCDTTAAMEGQKWVQRVLGSGTGLVSSTHPADRFAPAPSTKSASALAVENTQLRWELSELRSQLHEAHTRLAAAGPPDKWVGEQESRAEKLESFAARNRMLETALSTAEAQLRRYAFK